FDESEDAWTLFSNSVKKAAVVYSKIDNAAASINTLGNISEDIPLGIRTSEASELKFVIDGAETFDGEVYLVDAAQGREINLTETPDYTFQNTTGDIPDRFYIRIREAATSIYKGTATPDIRIYQENGTVHITSASDDPLRNVEISNAQGQIIARREGSSSNITIPIPSGNQVIVVKAVSEKKQAVKKVRV
ncbi:MAG: DUF6383 domain-containing protein, partial [Tannerella sp.]|nr:DUF6383 domain-containing protein [Tannerella sp.]